MRRFVRSETYSRVRVIAGAAFILLGAVVVVRTLILVPLDSRVLPPIVMGIALIALGAFRIRDFWLPRRKSG